MRLTIVGSGDAFGSGGRLQTCFHVATAETTFLIDCGATALIGLKKEGLDPQGIDAIFISHLHGDHFSGLVWFILHALHVEKRERPLVIVGPRGIEARYRTTTEALFPGSLDKPLGFDLQFYEHIESSAFDWRDVSCSVAPVSHPSGAPSYGLRFEAGGKTLSFSGDTEWVDELLQLSDGADVHINECFAFEGTPRYHTSWSVLSENLPRFTARRIVLTHMSGAMLAASDRIDHPSVILGRDGLQLDV